MTKKLKIAVLGDAMKDRFFIGEVLRLNPDDPSVPLVTCTTDNQHFFDFHGGAANVAANVASIGADSRLFASNIIAVKNRIVANGKVVLRFDCDPKLSEVSSPDYELIAPQSYSALIISDYGKGAVNLDDGKFCEWANSLNLPIFVDTKKPSSNLNNAIYFPNEKEYEKDQYLYDSKSMCVIKMGPKGARLIIKGRPVSQKASFKTNAINASGAGDTFIAAFSVAFCLFLNNFALENTFGAQLAAMQAIEVAIDFAGVAVSNLFTAAPTFDDVLNSGNNLYDSTKVLHKLMGLQCE